ncbi:MAG: hypothetical protein ACI4LI_03675 [Candidatus Fimenecus sp.]
MDCVKCDRCGRVVPKNHDYYVEMNFNDDKSEVHKDICKICFENINSYIENKPLELNHLCLLRSDRLLRALVEIYHDNAVDGLTVDEMIQRIIDVELGKNYKIFKV